MELIDAREPQLISYGFYIDEASSRMTVVAVHPDSASLELHMDIGSAQFRKLAHLVTITEIGAGQPSERALEQLRQKATASEGPLFGSDDPQGSRTSSRDGSDCGPGYVRCVLGVRHQVPRHVLRFVTTARPFEPGMPAVVGSRDRSAVSRPPRWHPGARYSVHSSGRTTKTAGVPGRASTTARTPTRLAVAPEPQSVSPSPREEAVAEGGPPPRASQRWCVGPRRAGHRIACLTSSNEGIVRKAGGRGPTPTHGPLSRDVRSSQSTGGRQVARHTILESPTPRPGETISEASIVLRRFYLLGEVREIGKAIRAPCAVRGVPALHRSDGEQPSDAQDPPASAASGAVLVAASDRVSSSRAAGH